MPYASLRFEVAPTGVATIALDRPATRNALADDLVEELRSALAAAEADPAVRCVVLASTHERTFSAGGDLSGFAAPRSEAERAAAGAPLLGLYRALAASPLPVVCAVDGHCLAGAVGVALSCDLVLASERATFGTPEIDVGLFPFMVSALLLRDVGRKHATELLLLGERVSAREAERLGIVNRVVPAEDFAASVAGVAERLASKPPGVVAAGKAALARQAPPGFDASLDALCAELGRALGTADAAEGLRAFFERREPRWTGR